MFLFSKNKWAKYFAETLQACSRLGRKWKFALLRIGAWTSIASRGLSLNPPLLSLHLLALIVNHNSVIHERLEVGVCIGHKLELETIIQTLKKATMFISIINHRIRSIT